MPIKRRWILALAAILAAPSGAQQIETQGIAAVPVEDGPAMYQAYCASCHGPLGKGDGPAAKALKTAASDLTRLSRNNYGAFPALSVLMVLRPQGGGSVHGSPEMPVWGDVFRRSGMSDVAINLRTYNLMRYLESIQEATPPPVSRIALGRSLGVTEVRAQSGSDLYRAYCASCHGFDGEGDGPSAYALKSKPTDLRKLRASNGRFPAFRLQELLSKAGPAAHGSAEMPVWGELFRASGEDQALVKLRIHNLVRHVESMQRN